MAAGGAGGSAARCGWSWSSPLHHFCVDPLLRLSSQAFLPLLKKAAQGSLGSGLSCSKAAIINMSSYAGSIQDVYLWEYGQALSYRCSKVLPHCWA